MEWIGLPSRTTITVKVTLVGDESSTYHDLQQDFLENLPERLGRRLFTMLRWWAAWWTRTMFRGAKSYEDFPRVA